MLQSLYIDPAYQGMLGTNLPLLQERSQQIPGSVLYTVRRYKRMIDWTEPDEGLMAYQFDRYDVEQSSLELHFLLTGQIYCREKQISCDRCRFQESDRCVERIESVDLLSFRYSPQHLRQWSRPRSKSKGLLDELVGFKRVEPLRQDIPLTDEVMEILLSILNHTYRDNLANIFVNAQSQLLLLHALDSIERPDDLESAPFLTQPSEREKIQQARDWLIENIGDPITIKELSRKVAINECYLKKGFRLLYGITIFDFFQSQRMEHARYLLYEKGLSVTEVSVQLGYSSISHFSTAFKKHTGLNPCDLLGRYGKIMDPALP